MTTAPAGGPARRRTGAWVALGCGGVLLLVLCVALVAGVGLLVVPGEQGVPAPAAATVTPLAAATPDPSLSPSPVPTAVPVPAAVPVPTPGLAVAGTPLAFPDRTDATGSWTGGRGTARAVASAGQFTVLPAAGGPLSDGIVEAVIAQQAGEPARWMGLVLRYQDPDNFLVVSLNGERTLWQFYRRQGGSWTTIVNTAVWEGVIRPGEPVRLRVDASGDLFTVVINGVAAGTVRDGTWARGAAGLGASSVTGPVTVQFSEAALDPLALLPRPAQLPLAEAPGTSSRVTVVPGGLQLEVTSPGVTSLYVRNWSAWADVRMEATVQQVAGPAANDFGFLLRVQDLQQLMLAVLRRDGSEWALYRRQGAEWIRVGGGGVPAGSWRPGQPNRFAVEARRDTYTFFLNGERIGEARDGILVQGGLGISAESPAAGGIAIRFTDWLVEPPAPR